MSKGDWRRPSQITKQEEEQRWADAFGPGPKLNVMNDEERFQLNAEKVRIEKGEPYWTGPGYQGEYQCLHGVGHGNHTHGCDGCCERSDFPLRGVPEKEDI